MGTCWCTSSILNLLWLRVWLFYGCKLYFKYVSKSFKFTMFPLLMQKYKMVIKFYYDVLSPFKCVSMLKILSNGFYMNLFFCWHAILFKKNCFATKSHGQAAQGTIVNEIYEILNNLCYCSQIWNSRVPFRIWKKKTLYQLFLINNYVIAP